MSISYRCAKQKKTLFRWFAIFPVTPPLWQIRDTKEARQRRSKEKKKMWKMVRTALVVAHGRIRKSRSFLHAIRRKKTEKALFPSARGPEYLALSTNDVRVAPL